MKNINFIFLGILLTVGIVAVSGCTSQSSSVTIQNMAFTPSTLHIPGGTTVTWINKDNIAHEVVSDTGLFDSGILASGDSFNYTFNQQGDYAYHCSIHPSMVGIIIVSSSSSSSSTVNSNNSSTSTVTPIPSSPIPSSPGNNPTPSNPTPAPSNPGGSGTNGPGY
jgi:plastocyanin